jgi:serine/threonine protein kinase
MMGERVDARCDLFSFGVVFYEALSHRLPYPNPKEGDEEGDAEQSLLARMQRGRHVKLRKLCPRVPRGIARLIQGCLRPRAKHRMASAAQIRRRLEKSIGPLSPTDLRRELASWLWERQVFETRDNETLVLVSAPREPGSHSRVRRSWLAAAAAVTAALLAYHVAVWREEKAFGLLPAINGAETQAPHANAAEQRNSSGFVNALSLAGARVSRTLSQAGE